MSRCTQYTPIALRWLDHFGVSNCNYRPSRCAAVYAMAELVRLVHEYRARARRAERAYADLHEAVHGEAELRRAGR